MNAVEIEEAVSELANQPFDAAEFPFAFLAAFGNKETTIKRLRTASANSSDVAGGVLQRSNIHIATCAKGKVGETLVALRTSPKTTSNKAKFILATDGVSFEAEDLVSGETVVCEYPKFPDHFGLFLALAGITTVKQIRESSFDIRATGRLNKLYVELLKDNPDWATAERRPDMNHFMARLIFCFFAEDTDIFNGEGVFTSTIDRMSERDSSNTHEVVSTLFQAMNTKMEERAKANLPRWANGFPYVNGGLFSGSTEVPRFSKIARSYLLHIGGLNWKLINPDIFGSMIQAVADDDERGALGMHYTSVPNILKVLNPLFLDDIRTRLEEAGTNSRMLLNLRRRISRIRVFDPACGSGNFLVISYKQLRHIEAEINKLRGEPDRRTDIPLTNFRGIEIRDFSAEVARLALIIAEYQCDVIYRGQKEALAEFLPLDSQNWIVCENALRLDWLSVCPPSGTGVKLFADDLFGAPLDQPQIDFENEGGETYICGNPPYFGSKWQSSEQKADLAAVFGSRPDLAKNLDYVAGWFLKAAKYLSTVAGSAAFVTTNSICQGQQVPLLWPLLFAEGLQIAFAHTSFKWSNLAASNAGVTVCIVAIGTADRRLKRLFELDADGRTIERKIDNINAYLIAAENVIVETARKPLNGLAEMVFGNMPRDAGHLLLTSQEMEDMKRAFPSARKYLKRFQGAEDFTAGKFRGCLWINEADFDEAKKIEPIETRMAGVSASRSASSAASTKQFAEKPYRFVQIQGVAKDYSIIIPRHTSENRDYLPVGINTADVIIADSALAIYDAPLWNMSLIVSKMHLVWIAAVCGKIKTDYRYSSTMGWNTFPIPALTDKNKDDLTKSAGDILIARERNFPKTISELYEPGLMPEDLKAAHEINDEIIDRIFIGRRFRNDTERLEKLFSLYVKMISDGAASVRAPLKKQRSVKKIGELEID